MILRVDSENQNSINVTRCQIVSRIVNLRGGYISYSLSNNQSQGRWEEGEDSLATGTPRKAPTGQNLQQLDEVPRSLGGRSRKAKKVARNGTTKSWENRVGRNQFGHKSSRSLETKAFTPGNLHQKFLGSLEGRRIKARISRTRNNLWRGVKLR